MHSIFDNLLILLTISLVITAICQRVKIPVIIGYILAGILVGPHTTGIIQEAESIHLLAEFGIVFLMFMVGLEFSLTQLLRAQKDVFGFGALQVILSITFTILIGLMLKMTMVQSLIVGTIVAMSSTAIVLKQLTEQLESNAPYSQHALGILLFQDLAVIPILILMPNLDHLTWQTFVSLISLALVKGFFAILIIFFIGRRVLRPLFYNIISPYSLELFTLTTLFLTLRAAWLTSHLGLSMALGSFLAGMMLGETEFRHQIKTDSRPFRDVLVGFFFITIGMQFRPETIMLGWEWMLLLLLALLLFKTLLITLLGLYFTQSRIVATQVGLLLAQGGEFGFAILINALALKLLPPDYGQVIIGALLLSMAIAPLLIKYHQKIIQMLFPHTPAGIKEQAIIDQSAAHLSRHIILCGYGRVGQNIARFLEKASLSYVALDMDLSRVKKARLAGDNVFYADATDADVLRSANLPRARAVIVSFDNPHATISIIEEIRKDFKQLPIIVRSHDENETKLFYEKGATEVIPEILEASLMIASHILLLMNVPPKQVYRWIDESRQNRYDLLRMIFPGRENLSEQEKPKEELYTVILTAGAYAINRKINELPLDQEKVKITAVRRGHRRLVDPEPALRLQVGDVVVLYGESAQLEHAENILLLGK